MSRGDALPSVTPRFAGLLPVGAGHSEDGSAQAIQAIRGARQVRLLLG